jgi:hypothetical protein
MKSIVIVIAIVAFAALSSGCTNIESKVERAVHHGEPVDLAKEQQKEGG